ncbi:restriction endonuclease subunit S [Streptomyces kanamyceticus]|uniref:restriction endonuclease subunit S n=1 Tax=Streptomyces kanamyceticus TaxID=1967 RepID=UPI0037DC0A13
MFERVKDVGHPNEELLSVYREHGVVRRGGRDDNFNKAALDRSIYQLIHPGWFVVNRMKAWQGSVGVSAYRGIVSGHYICFRPTHAEDHKFLNWLFRSGVYTAEYSSLSRGVRPNQVEIDNDWLRSLRVMLPSLEEQRRIADFLDAEVARIDRLRQRDVQLINLLAERRQAVIDHEVEAASGALVKLFWKVSLLRDGTHQPPPRVDFGVPLLTARNVSTGKLRLTEIDTHVGESDADILDRSFRLEAHDVLLSVKGTIGACAVTPSDFPRVVLDRNVALLRPLEGQSSEWLCFVLRSTRLQQQMRISVAAAAQPGLPLGVIRELRVPDVPSPEQRERVAYISARCKEIDDVLDRVECKQSVLAERRQSLITAAVTGKFDVSTASGRNVTDGI